MSVNAGESSQNNKTVVNIDLNQPIIDILEELDDYPSSTQFLLSGSLEEICDLVKARKSYREQR